MYHEYDDEGKCIWSFDPTIHIASMDDSKKLESLLLESEKYDCWLNQRDGYGCTPLRMATQVGNKESCYILTEYGADPDLLDWEGQTCLDIAAQNNDYDLVEHYLELGSDPNRHSINVAAPLRLAVENENQKMVELFLDNGAHVDGGLNNDDIASCPLGLAILKLNLPIVQCLLNAGANPNIQANPNSLAKPDNNLLVINTKHPNSSSENGMSADIKYIAKLSYSFLLLTEYSLYFIQPDYSKIPNVIGKKKDILLTMFAAGHKPFVTDLEPKLDVNKKPNGKACHMKSGQKSKSRKPYCVSSFLKKESLLYAKPFNESFYKLLHPKSLRKMDKEILKTIINMTSKPLLLSWLCRLVIRKALLDECESINQDYTSELPLPAMLKDFISLKILYL